MHVDTLIKGEKFVSRAVFSPDATQLLVDASGEAFDGIGLKIKEGQTSNTSDGQLFLYNIADKSIKPLTKNFDPSVDSYEWNALDKQIYITAKDKDRVRMYSLNPSNGKIKQLQAKEDVISDYSIANQAFEMVYFGLSASNSQRLYTYNLKNDASSCLIDLSKEILRDVTLGEVQDWNFVSAQGDTIYGRFYLPPHFDATKKYPMIVNYYGGTTPTARVMESRYPSHVYAGLGYIVYIIQPSGATGFGQEFSARMSTHGVNLPLTRSSKARKSSVRSILCQHEENRLHGGFIRRFHDSIPTNKNRYIRGGHVSRGNQRHHQLLGRRLLGIFIQLVG